MRPFLRCCSPNQIGSARRLIDKTEARQYVAEPLNAGRSMPYRALAGWLPSSRRPEVFHNGDKQGEIMDWIGKDHVLFLTGVPECEPSDLARLVEPLGLKGSITTRYALAESEIRRLVFEKGISYLWQLMRLQEDILPRTPDLPALLAVLQNMLRRIAPTEELIIVDRWLLPRACPDCLDTLTHLISAVVNSVSRIVLITRKEHDEGLLNDLRTALKSRKCEVVHGVSENFHDRFWIADRARGLFVGTSPNGLGKRYALADYMIEDDVRVIIEALSVEGLLP